MPHKCGRGSRAKKYIEDNKAEYKTRRNIHSHVDKIDIVARKGSKKLVIGVKSSKQAITPNQIKKLPKKSQIPW